ncbi:recombinase family protein [Catenovulum agarivorans]|uniref:recombinase family protein n=1 Tax=Catenovulum agarivorans TaxID=1172192 RepID=UPI0003096BD2|nr:recombinase family protein [Catenovulum agarivorans]
MAKVGYIRVSTVEQNTDRQLAGVKVDKVFEDKCSGKDTNRPALKQLLDYVRAGDEIHVHDISRLARNLEDLLNIVKSVNKKGISIHFHKESLAFTGEANPMQDLMLSLLGSVYQFERSMLKERQLEGIAQAKAKGKYKGRPTNTELHDKVLELKAGGLSLRKIADQCGCALSTVQRVLNQSEQ